MNLWAVRTPADSELAPLGRAFGFYPRSELLEHFDYYPPLWYGGVGGLLATQATPSFAPLIMINAVALAVSLWAGWDLAKRTTGAWTGFLSVLVIAGLPLVAGRMNFVGVEPSHMAMLGLSLRGLVLLRDPSSSNGRAIGLGAIVGAGLLMKWNFVLPLLGPAAVEAFAAWRAGPSAKQHRRQLLLAGGTASLLFAVWFIPYADLSIILGREAGMLTEPTSDGGIFSVGQFEALFPVVDFGLGWAGLFLLMAAWFGLAWEAGGDRTDPPAHRSVEILLLASIATLSIGHFLIPHKELRYFVPAGWALGLLIAFGLNCLWTGKLRSIRSRAIVVAGLGWLFFSTFGVRALDEGGFDVRLFADSRDYGFAEFTELPPAHPGQGRGVVLSPATQDGSEVGASLAWEFTSRSPGPLVVQVFPDTISHPLAEQAFQYADFFGTNRELSADEQEYLSRHRFVPIREVTLDADDTLGLPGAKDWVLWAPDGD